MFLIMTLVENILTPAMFVKLVFVLTILGQCVFAIDYPKGIIYIFNSN